MATICKYGAVDNQATDPSLLQRAPSESVQHHYIDDCPSRAGQPKGRYDALKRYLTLASVCGFAVVTFMLATRGDRMPLGATGASPSNSESFSQVHSASQQKPANQTPADHSGERRPASSHDAPLAFTALNFYHVRDGKPGASYPWLQDVKLVEPHRETALAVTNAREGFDYRWEVHTESDGLGRKVHATGAGSEVDVVLTQLDENVITLEEVDAKGVVTRTLRETVIVKYVRRDITSLTDEERDELMDAMLVLWTVRIDGGDGEEIYGKEYADIYAINRLHFKAASAYICDHFHDGLGFLTSHSLLTNTFEHSLQLVNPKLAVPYWDFTMETSSAYTAYDIEDPATRSPMFSSDWFGSYDATDNLLKDGRWGYTKVPTTKDNNPGSINPDVYGRLRAPWTVNERPYLTRGMGKMCGVSSEPMWPWPTCEMHYDLVMNYPDFYSWVWQSLYDPHGPVHIFIGGVVDCDDTYGEIGRLVGEFPASQLASLSFVHRKDMYREGIFKCEGTAEIDEKPADVMKVGTCGCLDYDLSQGDDWQSIYNTMRFIDFIIGDQNDEAKRQVVSLICSRTINDGDHLQASSSLDPSFWSIHPTMERVWMYSVLTGQVDDFAWPDHDITVTEEDGSTSTEVLSLYTSTCNGHHGSDVFPFGLLADDEDDFTVWTGIKGSPVEGGNTLSNREVLQAFDPRVNVLPYVYDTFAWEHCEADGFDFTDAKNSRGASKPRAAAKRRPSFQEGAPRFPMYSSLKAMTDSAKAKKPIEH